MPYIMKKIADVKNKKAYEILLNYGFSMSKSQKFIDKSRLICNQNLVKNKNEILNGEIFLIDYKCEPKNLKPVFENENFAIFDKPSGILSHPNGRNAKYNLYDEIWSRYSKQACVAHRLDKETSGLIVVGLNPKSTKILKEIFEKREIKKSYLALCEGLILNNFSANFKISKTKNDDIRLKMEISENGKEAITDFEPLKHFVNFNDFLFFCHEKFNFFEKKQSLEKFYNFFGENSQSFLEIINKNLSKKQNLFSGNFYKINFNEILNMNFDNFVEIPFLKQDYGLKNCATLVNCKPKTGRQHQIRLHLFHMKHRIFGDPLYGVGSEIYEAIINENLQENDRKKITKASRLLLHAKTLEFNFLDENFKIESKINFEEEIMRSI